MMSLEFPNFEKSPQMLSTAQHQKMFFSDSICGVESDILKALLMGLQFLRKTQKSDGAFVTNQIAADGKKEEISTPFVPALILSALASVQINDNHFVGPLIIKAARFLRSQIDPDGFVCFFGKDSSYPRDTDDTAMAWYALLRSRCLPVGVIDDARIKAGLDAMHDGDGLVRVWKGRKHTVSYDYVVACNVFRFWTFAFQTVRYRTKTLLKNFFESDGWKLGSPYYGNPYVALSVAVGLGGPVLDLISGKVRFRMIHDLETVLFQQTTEDSLVPFIVFTLTTLGKINGRILNVLLETQNQSGSWPCASLFQHVNRYCYYESMAVSTTFGAVALARMQKVIGG